MYEYTYKHILVCVCVCIVHMLLHLLRMIAFLYCFKHPTKNSHFHHLYLRFLFLSLYSMFVNLYLLITVMCISYSYNSIITTETSAVTSHFLTKQIAYTTELVRILVEILNCIILPNTVWNGFCKSLTITDT